MKSKKNNVRRIEKWRGYYMEDMQCSSCRFCQGRKRGCKLANCCCDDEKLDAIKNGRIKRKRGAKSWDS
jgi:hypothetical protein